MQGSFGDVGSLRPVRDGAETGQTGFPFGVFEVPSDDALYELSLKQRKIGQPAAVWKRSTQLLTTWTFRSRLDESAYSQGIPLLFPAIRPPGRRPQDGRRERRPADRPERHGSRGYEPGALTGAKLSYSYDGGDTWTEAATEKRGDGSWAATVDHAGASGRTVTLRTELTDAKGNSVTQLVLGAYAVR